MHSRIYEGTVHHARHEPVVHQFQYRLFMAYLDLDELPELTRAGGLLGTSRFAVQSFLRQDHLFDHSRPLAKEVRDLVESETGQRPSGPIRVLTQLRILGYFFSPLNLFYVFDRQGTSVETIVAEVHNTPWKERHGYILWSGNRCATKGAGTFEHRKAFHVSPFMPMDLGYRWRLSDPGESLTVHLANLQEGREIFCASMSLRRRELSRKQLRRMMMRHPWMTAKISVAIYLQALQLWWKQCPFHSHPKKRGITQESKPSNLMAASSKQHPRK